MSEHQSQSGEAVRCSAVVRRRDWNTIFAEAHLHSWPTASIAVQNAKPPHETARNIFKDDEREIMAAAHLHGYRIVSPPKAKVVSFVKSSNDGTQRGRDAEATNATETRTRPSLK